MADNVEVKFGAEIGGLVAGVNTVKEQVESLTAPIEAVNESFRSLGEAVIAGLALERVTEAMDKYAELGETISRTARITGISTDQVQLFTAAIKLSGGDAETAAGTLNILQKNIGDAISKAGPARAAFEGMGFSLQQLKSTDIVTLLFEMKQRLDEAGTSAEQSALKMEYMRTVAGRAGAQFLGMKDNLEEVRKIVAQTGSSMSPGMATQATELADSIKTLNLAWLGLGNNLSSFVAPIYDSMIKKTTSLIEGVSSLFSILNTPPKGSSAPIGFFAALSQMNTNPQRGGASASWGGGSGKDLGEGQFGPTKPKPLKPLDTDSKAGADGDNGDLDYAKNQYQTQIQLSHLAFEQIQQDQLGLVDAKKETAVEGTQAVMAALELESIVTQAALNKEAGLYEQDSVEYAQVQNKKALATAQFTLEASRLSAQMAKAQQEATKTNEQTFKAATDLISRDLDQMLSGVLSGTQSWEQAMDKLFSNLAVSFVEAVLKMMAQWVAFEILTSGFGVAGLASPLSGGIGSVVGGALGIKSYDVGSWKVANDQLAMIHQNEMIVPAQQASAIRSGSASLGGSGSSGGNFTININAIDTQTGAQFLKSNAGIIANALSGQARNFNPRMAT